MTINEVTKIALNYLNSFYDTSKPVLEEIEISDDNKYWYITLSYESDDVPVNQFQLIPTKSRKYKIFKIEAETGEVRSMKIRDIK
ncbi:hypothetical protein [Acetobacteroides hydrogenigenes]|uniref:Uncharacterized protein n=1 Tax=Acetobacteroides hydrogenigenes TaxID=979970 RepID=A0A4R2EB31_9BACT|nr:hypothetical protein [Acetobacteroides hydrogenigenes]TCN65411.1 hypothetical protein CLV25_11191 [Acetobacteroides hydrogenigenes]